MTRLSGKTVVVTRARRQADELVEALDAEGAEVLSIPAIEIVDPEDWAPVKSVVARLSDFDLVLLSSQNAGARFLSCARAGGVDPRATEYACVGDKTAAWLEREIGVTSIVPSVFRGEALADAVSAQLGPLEGRRILIPEAEQARGAAANELRSRGAMVDSVVVYRIVSAPPASEMAIAGLMGADAITFLSGNTLAAFLEVVGEDAARKAMSRCMVAVIGPVARAAADRLGIGVDVMPQEATVGALIEALAAAF